MRLRVGDWRVVFTEDGHVLAVIRIAPRGGVYE
jgi:mRNA interferase RelE/StbE